LECELPSGFVYWNENLIMAFDVWLSAGAFLRYQENWSPGDWPSVDAFLELTR